MVLTDHAHAARVRSQGSNWVAPRSTPALAPRRTHALYFRRAQRRSDSGDTVEAVLDRLQTVSEAVTITALTVLWWYSLLDTGWS